MPNVGGTNQFQGFSVQPPYGDVKRQAELAKQAAISGTEQAAGPLNTPRRAQRSTQRPPSPQAAPAPVAPPAPAPSPAFQLAQTWQQLAMIPGASDLVKQYAQRAARG